MSRAPKLTQEDRDQRDALLVAFALFAYIGLEIVDIDLHRVVDLAERFGMMACDAGYPWLARMLSAELVTPDARLAAAMASH